LTAFVGIKCVEVSYIKIAKKFAFLFFGHCRPFDDDSFYYRLQTFKQQFKPTTSSAIDDTASVTYYRQLLRIGSATRMTCR